MSIQAGTYVVRPKAIPDQALLVGPVPQIHPLPDVPLKVEENPVDQWTLNPAEDGTFTVFTGKGNPEDYKWIVKGHTVLFASSVSPPDRLRIESAGGPFFTIKLPDQDAALTVGDPGEEPRLTFRPSDGSDAQLYEFTRY